MIHSLASIFSLTLSAVKIGLSTQLQTEHCRGSGRWFSRAKSLPLSCYYLVVSDSIIMAERASWRLSHIALCI
jgi:hypothetical protein